jgi:hypothetical protein
LILTRAAAIVRPSAPPRPSPAWLVIAQIGGMFVVTNIGWLLFRETDLSAIVRDLRLSPFGVSTLDRQAGLYVFLLAFLYSVPLWIQSVWVEVHRASTAASDERDAVPVVTWRRIALQGIGCGLAFAAILVLRSQTSLDFIYFQF